MRSFLAGFALCLTLTSGLAFAADRSDDWIVTIDRESASGVIHRRISIAQHVDVAPADWAGLRGAAAQSQAALDGWMTTKGWGAWWTSFSAGQRADARAAILLAQ